METAGDAPAPDQPQLRRAIGLPLVVLYGLGVTIGAGIYVLVGASAGRGGLHAPSAFLLAALVEKLRCFIRQRPAPLLERFE